MTKLNRDQLRRLIFEAINEGYGTGIFSSEDKSDVFSAKPEQAKNHAKEYGKAYYIYKSEKDGNVYVDLYDKESKEFPNYIETDKTEQQVNKEKDIKKFYQGG